MSRACRVRRRTAGCFLPSCTFCRCRDSAWRFRALRAVRRTDPLAARGRISRLRSSTSARGTSRRKREGMVRFRLAAAEAPPVARRRQEQPLLARASCRRSTAAALLPWRLWNRASAMCGNRPSSMPARNTIGNSRPLALCSVSSETVRALVQIVGVGNQRGVIQKFGHRLAALGRLRTRRSPVRSGCPARDSASGSLSALEHPGVAGALQDLPQNVVHLARNRPSLPVLQSCS